MKVARGVRRILFSCPTGPLLLAITFFATITQAAISHQDLKNLAAAFHAEFDHELQAKNARFFINKPPSPTTPDFWWEQTTVRASYSSLTDDETGFREHYIFFFGGIAALPHMTVDAAVLTLCHEMGHGLAGAPFKYKYKGDDPVAIEAMADDYAARFCFKRMAKRIPASDFSTVSPFVENLCTTKFKDQENREFCRRAFRALEFDRIYFQTDPGIREDSSFEKKDPTVVTEINLEMDYYPPAQCRIDTMMAGLFDEERPRCWWTPAK